MADALSVVLRKVALCLGERALDRIGTEVVEAAPIMTDFEHNMKQIEGELSILQAFIGKVSAPRVGDEAFDAWLDQVRDVAHEVEDLIDEYAYLTAHAVDTSSFFKRKFHQIKNIGAWQMFSSQISQVEARIQRLAEMRNRYDISVGEVDRRKNLQLANQLCMSDSAYLTDKSDIVGNVDEIQRLTQWLLEEKQQQSIIAILGMGGLGKTTIANSVYKNQKIRTYFDCHAWITVSQTYEIEELLREIINQLIDHTASMANSFMTMNRMRLIEVIQNYLQDRKYFIVLDDIWDKDDWLFLNYAFVRNNCASKVLITTRRKDVSSLAIDNYVIELKTLQFAESWELFCKKAFRGSKENICPENLRPLAEKIVGKCQGLPLAIVTIGSTLSYRQAIQQYPGDPRARLARGFCSISATGSIRRNRNELIDKAAVCWLNDNGHDTEAYNLGDALRCQLHLHHSDFQVVEHYPEQYLVIFSDPAIRQRLVELETLTVNRRVFHFAAWSERRYAKNVNWEFRVKVRIEGIPVHCWAEDVAAKALGKSCSVQYVEETTHCRECTRSFDLWAWSSNPSDIPTEVWLTMTEPDRELLPPFHNDPVDLKHGHVYVLRNHLEVVEDLSFLRGQGRFDAPPNRKARREFIWSYGVPDTEGERLHGRHGNNRGREMRCRPRNDDDDYDDRHNHGMRHHRSHSSWARNARCRAGVKDYINTNRLCGHRDSPPRRSRAADGQQRPTLVWKVKAHKEEEEEEEEEKKKKKKKVSFADPIAIELKPPKTILPDDSIMLIKGDTYTQWVADQCTVHVETKKQAVEFGDDCWYF